MTQRYFGSWSGWESMRECWRDGYGATATYPDIPPDAAILFASYGGAAYEGDALVIFEQDGQLYEVHGGHCSCYGLEGQWTPEQTSWAALAMRERRIPGKYYHYLSDHDREAQDAYWTLVDARAAE